MIAIVIKSIQCLHDGGMVHLFLGAAQLMFQKIPIYNHPIQIIRDIYQEYSYSPFFAFVLIPISFIRGDIVEILWLLLNIFFMFRIAGILSNHLKAFQLTQTQKEVFILLTLAFVFRFVLANFGEAQMNIFLLFVCLESLNLFARKKLIAGSALLAFGITMKIIPVILLPYLLYRSYFKEFAISVTVLIVFFLMPYIFFESSYVSQSYISWWKVIHPGNSDFILHENNWEGIQSISALCAALFTNENHRYDLTRNICVLDESTLNLVITILRLLFLVSVLFFLRTLPFKKNIPELKSNWELSYIFLITPLIFPHQGPYSFVFIAPAVAFIIHYLILNWKSEEVKLRVRIIFSLMILSFILTTITTDGIIGRHYCNLANYFKLITYGTIILIIPLYMSMPEKQLK